MTDMTIETRDFDNPARPYKVVTERLTVVDGREYVHCALHGLIPLDHQCSKSPGDHWCREAAHPNYDPADGNQATPHDEWDHIQSTKVQNWKRTAQEAAEALRLADLYLDGFMWLSDPEWGELRDIKRASKKAQRRVAVLTERNGLSARQLAVLRAEPETSNETPT